jgi:hypothetical protein
MEIQEIKKLCLEATQILDAQHRDSTGQVDPVTVTRLLVYVLDWLDYDWSAISGITGYGPREVTHMYNMHARNIVCDQFVYYATCQVIRKLGHSPDGIFNGDVVTLEDLDDALMVVDPLARFRWPEGSSVYGFARWLLTHRGIVNRHYYLGELRAYLLDRGIDPDTSGFMPLVREKAQRLYLFTDENAVLTEREAREVREFSEYTGFGSCNERGKYCVRELLGLVADGLFRSVDDIDKYPIEVLVD